jgi:hypothetical protein
MDSRGALSAQSGVTLWAIGMVRHCPGPAGRQTWLPAKQNLERSQSLECRKGRCGTHSKLNKLSLVKKVGKFVGMQEKGLIYNMVSGFPVKVEVPKEAAFTYEGVSPTSSVLTVVRVGDCEHRRAIRGCCTI